MARYLWQLLFTLLIIFGSVYTYLYSSENLLSVDKRLRDFFFISRGSIPHTDNIVIIDIDEKSLRQYGQWPWSRDIVAQMLVNLTNGGAGIIGLDIFFSEADKSSPRRIAKSIGIDAQELDDYDEILAGVIEQTPTVGGYVFDMDHPTTETNQLFLPGIYIEPSGSKSGTLPEAEGIILNIPTLQDKFYSAGFLNNMPDVSGIIRYVPMMIKYENVIYPSLAMEMLRIFAGVQEVTFENVEFGRDLVQIGDINVSTDDNVRIQVNFRGPAYHFPYISAADILNNDFNSSSIEGRFVLVGTSAVGLADLRAMPYDALMPGIEIHANVIDNVLAQDYFRILENSQLVDMAIITSLAILFSLIFTFLRAELSFLLFILFGFLLYWIIYTIHFEYYTVINILFPFMTLIFSYISVTIINYAFVTRQEQAVKNIFAKKVSKAVMEDLVKNGDQDLLKARDCEVSIFFSDIRSFTSISEQIGSAHKLIKLLNEYMTPMVDIIAKNEGTVDKFIGDAIMAYWNAPNEVENHADKAVRSALEQLKVLDEINDGLYETYGFRLEIGIGINTGDVTVGDMGSTGRSDYTIIGDQVNLASRLEGLNKRYGSHLIISSFTKDKLEDDYLMRSLDWVKVKGKAEAVEIFEVILETDSSLDQIDEYNIALAQFRDGKLESALEKFKNLSKKTDAKLYDMYISRCHHFLDNPEIEFTVVETMTTK